MPRKKKTDSKKVDKQSVADSTPKVQPSLSPVLDFSPANNAKPADKLLRRKDFLAIDEAINYLIDQLQQNPLDQQQARHLLTPLLVEVDRLDEADVLIKQFVSDNSAHLLYSRALLNFKKYGPCPLSDSALEHAVRQNPAVLDFLCGADMPAVDTDSFEPGSKEEAVNYLEVGMEGWLSADGAIIWLADYLMEELTRFNHSMDLAGAKFEGVKSSDSVLNFNP